MKNDFKNFKHKKKIRLMLGDTLLYSGYRSFLNKDLICELKVDTIEYDPFKEMYEIGVSLKGISVFPYVLVNEDEKDYRRFNVWKRVCVKYIDGPEFYRNLAEFEELIENPCELIMMKHKYLMEIDKIAQTSIPDEILYDYTSLCESIKEFSKIYTSKISACLIKANKAVVEYHTCSAMYRFRDFVDMIAETED